MKEQNKAVLLEKATKWYTSGNRDLKNAALELFTKEEIESNIDKKKKEEKAAEDEEFAKVFDKCKKTFPVGSIIWSSDGTDMLVNIIISEPYIKETGSIYSSIFIKKQIRAKTIRLNSVLHPLTNDEGAFIFSHVNLYTLFERLKYEQAHNGMPQPYYRKVFVNLKDFYESENLKRIKNIADYKKQISEYELKIKDLNDKIKILNEFDPTILTQEYANSLIKKINYDNR